MLPIESRFNPNACVVRPSVRRAGAHRPVAKKSEQPPRSSTGTEDSDDSTSCPSKKLAPEVAMITAANTSGKQREMCSTVRPKRRTAIEVI